ncbi:sulfate ABC transporter substrate-binding protein [Uliginosibacterium sp. H3]|uniref:Sulfate ABC transporter substrate-binding protein n=1 Tax=Uliginosibacterium silvisoli TaxID=3114758 RepID=A0ABU6K6D3_9RHOO|nr:sulfate ABC transporter substrate-binding protein [Uliginosibacterium sp. H3]
MPRILLSPAMLPIVLALCSTPTFADTTLTNYSYTATKQMYGEYDQAFAKYWKSKTGEVLTIKTTHANSSTQASKVKNGEEADIISASVAHDIDGIADANVLPEGWQRRLEGNSSPYTSTIVFLVRTGNPKGIKDWPDLVRWGVNIVMSNPKSSGGARWSHLAAYGYALKQPGATEATARNFLKRMYANNRVLEYTARGATNTFVKNKLGDVMVSWENEAFQAIAENPGQFEIIVPSISILAEPPVAVVDKVVEKHGTRKVAEAYLQYLYSPEGQDIAARNFYRPSDPTVAARYSKQFAPVKLFRIEDLFGTWKNIQKAHFQDGGILDQVYDQYRNAS